MALETRQEPLTRHERHSLLADSRRAVWRGGYGGELLLSKVRVGKSSFVLTLIQSKVYTSSCLTYSETATRSVAHGVRAARTRDGPG